MADQRIAKSLTMYLFDRILKKYPKRFGTFLALIGVLVLTPDTMVMRFSNLDRWPLMGWRGVLMGVTLLIIWRFLFFSNTKKKLRTLYTWPGIIVIISFSIISLNLYEVKKLLLFQVKRAGMPLRLLSKSSK